MSRHGRLRMWQSLRGVSDSSGLGDWHAADVAPPSLAQLTLYFLHLGATGFGGPIALAGRMQRTLVDERRWFSRRDFLDGLALAQLAPGPLAAQLAMYLGAVNYGAIGATIVGAAFVLPSFAIVWLLAAAYVRFGGMTWLGSAFYGVGAAVIAIIARAAWKLASTTLRRSPLLWTIWSVMAIVTAFSGREIIWLFLAAGFAPLVAQWLRRPRVTATMFVLLPALIDAQALRLFLFFAKAGAFVFGSGLAVVPFLYGEVVQRYHWLSDRQFLDAVAVAMITPGPVVITASFIGYLVAREPGMIAASIGVFLPAWLIVLAFAKRFRAVSHRPSVRLFVDGVTAAASGAMAGAVFLLGRRALIDVPTVAIALAALLLPLRWKRLGDVTLIAAAAIAGLLLKGT
ncbi:MAG: chromate transporter [Acidobacteriota bacterium]|nr:chromate transporter [Acidobacteriota bacterium]